MHREISFYRFCHFYFWYHISPVGKAKFWIPNANQLIPLKVLRNCIPGHTSIYPTQLYSQTAGKFSKVHFSIRLHKMSTLRILLSSSNTVRSIFGNIRGRRWGKKNNIFETVETSDLFCKWRQICHFKTFCRKIFNFFKGCDVIGYGAVQSGNRLLVFRNIRLQ